MGGWVDGGSSFVRYTCLTLVDGSGWETDPYYHHSLHHSSLCLKDIVISIYLFPKYLLQNSLNITTHFRLCKQTQFKYELVVQFKYELVVLSKRRNAVYTLSLRASIKSLVFSARSKAEGPRFESALDLPSLQTLQSVDTVLWLLSLTIDEILKWFLSLPILMQQSFWWWQSV